MDLGGAQKVPIQESNPPVLQSGTTLYNGVTCYRYTVTVSSSSGSLNSVGLTPTSGTYVSTSSINVPASPSQTSFDVYVPIDSNSAVDVTANLSGYQDTTLSIRSSQ